VGESDEIRNDGRPAIYLVFSCAATLLFLFFAAEMLIVPGFMPAQKIWRLSIAATALAISLGLGLWRSPTGDTPITESRLHLLVGVILLVQLLWSATGIVTAVVEFRR